MPRKTKTLKEFNNPIIEDVILKPKKSKRKDKQVEESVTNSEIVELESLAEELKSSSETQPFSGDRKMTDSEQEALDNIPKISDKIRYLTDQNFATATIARILGKRYQHVRNVQKQVLKRS